MLLIVVPGLLWGAISPRSQWRALSAWQYRNPDANEPSDAAYGLARFSNIVALLVFAGVGIALATRDDDTERWVVDPSPSLPSEYRPPEPAKVGPLPIAGYQADAENPRRLNVVVYTGSPNVWQCRPELEVTAQSASQVVLEAAMVDALPDGPGQCKLVTTHRIVDSVFLDKPIGRRIVVTKGPMRSPNGKVLPAGAVRRLPVVNAAT
jgi:hypothetical protein